MKSVTEVAADDPWVVISNTDVAIATIDTNTTKYDRRDDVANSIIGFSPSFSSVSSDDADINGADDEDDDEDDDDDSAP